jgi:hypothetical protein
MPKGTKEAQGNGLSDRETSPETAGTPESPRNETPITDEPKPLPKKLTVGQFLKQSPKRADIDGLIRSLYSSRTMTFEEWDTEISSLLKKKIN